MIRHRAVLITMLMLFCALGGYAAFARWQKRSALREATVGSTIGIAIRQTNPDGTQDLLDLSCPARLVNRLLSNCTEFCRHRLTCDPCGSAGGT